MIMVGLCWMDLIYDDCIWFVVVMVMVVRSNLVANGTKRGGWFRDGDGGKTDIMHMPLTCVFCLIS